MNVARITVVIISVISIILASNPDSSVFEIVSFAWAGFGATFGPVVLCALFWKKANKYGITAGMISGGIISRYYSGSVVSWINLNSKIIGKHK